MKNIPASVRDRLLKIARENQTDFQLLLIRYFQERLLYRLSKSGFKNNFCLKGGALLYALEGEQSRPTLDLDLLGIAIANNHEKMLDVFSQVCTYPYEEDGVVFDASSITTTAITKEGKYPGIRLKVQASLGNVRQNLQIDIGFGDVITPKPVLMDYPVILDMEAPEIQAYSVETVIAEKFEAMIDLGAVNSRMKDFYDIYRLLQAGKFDLALLSEAVQTTFRNRRTPCPKVHPLFQDEFALDEQRLSQWAAFLRKSKLDSIAFQEVHKTIYHWLEPVYQKITPLSD
ncbi:MAG: nucleotidyl transferase AbiEii/AbiGii toxin family protein [Lewinellaceae bacterium]|nr:nucleotidyl transferase AbiEii/AbiGii toxin family protein [Saprospiraceae bacterium]MCB9334314.1 nucleotidyl transferase AbiEii/AbiGii toxin family protein [Lewinellaceae bacterium]